MLDKREERGLVIAALCKLEHKNGVWLVPSQSGSKQYSVDPFGGTCSCPDHQDAGFACKHLHAVKFTIKREMASNGDITETRSVTFTESPQPKTGRRRKPMADIVFACVFKVYCGMSSRRFACDLADAVGKGYMSKPLHSVTTCAFLESDYLSPILKELVEKSALPLRAIETTFAPDSTGFSVSRHIRWTDEKYGVQRSGRDWVKAHAICGVKTNVVTAVEIHGRDAGDCPQFKPLVEATAKNFTVKEVPADKAYLSHDNLAVVERVGGTAFIPMKCNSSPGEAGSLWERMYFFYQFKREQFAKHYHQRSNAESTFSMVKAKFGDAVRSKTDTAMRNECYCKFIAHNLCCVIQSQAELGIDADFLGASPALSVV